MFLFTVQNVFTAKLTVDEQIITLSLLLQLSAVYVTGF